MNTHHLQKKWLQKNVQIKLKQPPPPTKNKFVHPPPPHQDSNSAAFKKQKNAKPTLEQAPIKVKKIEIDVCGKKNTLSHNKINKLYSNSLLSGSFCLSFFSVFLSLSLHLSLSLSLSSSLYFLSQDKLF